ncbi:MAG: hypothetical protein ACRD2W_19890 [Acidimicrobiales bacterium]
MTVKVYEGTERYVSVDAASHELANVQLLLHGGPSQVEVVAH